MKPYSLDLRQKVVETYEAGGISQRQLAKNFRVTLSFVVLPELPWLPLDMEFSHFQEMNRFRLNQSVHSPADRGLSAEKSV